MSVKYESKSFVSALENCTCTVHSSSSNRSSSSNSSDLFNIDRSSAFISSYYLLSIQVSKVSLLSLYSYFMCFECTRLHPSAVYHHEHTPSEWMIYLHQLAQTNDAAAAVAATKGHKQWITLLNTHAYCLFSWEFSTKSLKIIQRLWNWIDR